MFSFLFNKPKPDQEKKESNRDFDYLDPKTYYFDSACTTLRPGQVIDAEADYYYNYNSCGHRVKYKWGEIVDKKVRECRESLLKLVGKSNKEYTVAFCLNTTSGLNLILQQMDTQKMGIKQVVTSEIEHNSVFLPTLVLAKKSGIKRMVLERSQNGSLNYKGLDLSDSLVVLNSTSNISGLNLLNLNQLATDVSGGGGYLVLDGCQTFAHNPEMLKCVDFDAVVGSGHKMYAPSVGFIIIKKNFLKKLDCYLIGGSTVQDVGLNDYQLIENDEEIYARLEAGLQNYGGIVGLNAAINWQKSWTSSILYPRGYTNSSFLECNLVGTEKAEQYEQKLALYLNKKLELISNIKILSQEITPIISFYPQKPGLDSHRVALYLSEVGIMCRSGYHCCHYYIKNRLNLPPLLRISLGLNNTFEQVDYLLEKLKIILS